MLLYGWLRNDFSVWHGKILAGCFLYYFAIRLIHSYLEAGPIALMLTALGFIFTVGLADRDEKDPRQRRELSAYHVFNRGMQRMMGDLDAEQMLNQHVGGGMFYNNNRNEAEQGEIRPRDRHNDAGDPDNNNNNNDGDNQAVAPHEPAAARRSRKKARGEQRRELQRQREAAAAIGEENMEDAVALQRLIEEQIRVHE